MGNRANYEKHKTSQNYLNNSHLSTEKQLLHEQRCERHQLEKRNPQLEKKFPTMCSICTDPEAFYRNCIFVFETAMTGYFLQSSRFMSTTPEWLKINWSPNPFSFIMNSMSRWSILRGGGSLLLWRKQYAGQ